MGLSKKHQVEGGKEGEGKKWVVIAGIAIRAPLKSISTRSKEVNGDETEDECSTTPTGRGSRIPERQSCPPAPRKRRPTTSTCHYNGAIEFFNPPDLESVFIRHVERAN